MKRLKKKLTLLPIMRPTFNAREIIKQNLLLEDHLFSPEKRCADCINKHFLTIEALAEEAVSLECAEPNKKCPPEIKRLATTIRTLHHAWSQAPKNHQLAVDIARLLRRLRKKLMKEHASLPVTALPTREQAHIKKLVKRVNNGRRGAARAA